MRPREELLRGEVGLSRGLAASGAGEYVLCILALGEDAHYTPMKRGSLTEMQPDATAL